MTRPVLVVGILSLCGILVSLQQTLLLPLLPQLPRLLGTSADNASWLVTATLLSGAIATPLLSRLADMYGKRRMLCACLGASVCGSVLGAVSTALPLMIGARALQGVGLAMIPIGIAIMRDELPREQLVMGVALLSATLALGAAVGLPLSGVIAEHLGWHAIFWVTAVVGAVMVVAVWRLLHESLVRTGGRFDWPGAALLTAGLTAGLLALSMGGRWGWHSPATTAAVVLGALLLAFWVPLELRVSNPLVDLRVAIRRPVLLANLASLLAGFAMFTNMLVTTQLLQYPEVTGFGLGLDVFDTGLWMVPGAVAFGVMAPMAAWLIRRVGPQVTMMAGALVMGATYVVRTFLSDGLGQITVGQVSVNIGIAMVFAALPALVTRGVPVTETASANGLNLLLRSVGTSTASATVAAVVTAGAVTAGSDHYPSWAAVAAVLWIAAASFAVCLIGIPMLHTPEYSEEPADAPSAPGPLIASRLPRQVPRFTS